MRVRQYQQHQHIEGYVKVTGGVERLRWDRPESAEGNICDEA
jgi:phage-related protein